jgi:hypothetical protein
MPLVFLIWVSMDIKISKCFCSLRENAGPLNNFEVLDFIRSRGAAKDSTRVLANVAPSEYKVGFYSSLSPTKFICFLFCWIK